MVDLIGLFGGDDPCNRGIIITFLAVRGFLAIKVIKHSVCPLSKYTVIGYARIPSSLPSPSHTHTHTHIHSHTHTHTYITLTHSAIVIAPLLYCIRGGTYVRTYTYVHVHTFRDGLVIV